MNRQFRALALSPFVGQRLTMCMSKERGVDVARLAELVASGSITPAIDRTYPLSRVPEAMRELEAGRVRGKVAIRL